MYRQVHLIVNPVSGRSRIGLTLKRLAWMARRNGSGLTIHETETPGHAAQIARDVGSSGDLVVAVGGDGTVREVAAGLVGLPSPLAVLPAGTENLFAREFGYRNDADAFWRLVRGGRRVPVDVGLCNEQRFLTMVGAGFDGLAVEHLQQSRRGHITHLHYLRPLWRSFWEYDFPPIRVTADGECIFAGRGLAFVGNLPRYAIGLRILQRARCDDGLLDVCVYPCSGRRRLIAHSCRTLVGRHLQSRDVIYRRCRRVGIDSDAARVPVQCDGDVAEPLPVDCRLLPQPVFVLVPPYRRFGPR